MLGRGVTARPTRRHGLLPCWLLACGIAFISSAANAGDRLALVIGNGAYSNAPRLANPANDAADIAQSLRSIGFEIVEGRDLDKRTMEQKIVEFGHKLDGANLALFFYAGHGLQVSGQNYLVPIDAKLQRAGDLSFETINVNQVLAQMEAEKRVNLVFLDACRDNPLARSFARTLGDTRSASVGRGLASIQSAVGTMIAYATQPDNTALDGTGRNSPFTAALLKHVATPGLEVRSMMTRVRADVLAATRDRQLPWDHSSLIGEVVLAPAVATAAAIPPQAAPSSAPPPATGPATPPAPPQSSEAERAWAITKDTTSRAVLQAFIKRHGKTIYGEMASARLKELEQQAPKPQEQKAPEPKPQDKVALVPQAQTRSAGPKVFENPTINGVRVDRCMKWGPTGCGAPAANYWCRSKGFAKATDSEWKTGPPTIFQDPESSVRVCDYFFCGGFTKVVCE
ncbi:caspase domain-containing protein [Bradyrhizobium sp.]|uniref:caspase family protein n=1 Tax=Bradyrhizobium sp. TaxID=376 RepID=UPI001D5E0A62|nr:caspase domain-containing protein [Bradyrhizobium sp.]MBI5319664.1 caspase family protein [Bradyrhizobium sp.]